MAEPVEVAIEKSLIDRLSALVLSPVLPVQLPEVAFTPPTPAPGAAWLKADFLPAPTTTIGIDVGSNNQHMGLLQVTVFWPRGEGEYKPARVAASVIAWFKKGSIYTQDGFRTLIWRAPYRLPLRNDASGRWVMIPVSIPYVCFAPDPA